jgi:cystathionine beta-lyase
MADHDASPYDFESITEEWLRSKHGKKWHMVAPLLGAWVADMDFRPAPVITDHLRSMLDDGDLGYPERAPTHGRMRSVTAFVERMNDKWGWSIQPTDIREWSDVVQSLQAFLHVCTVPGDRVVVHTPGYPPFFDSINDSRRELVAVPALIEGDSVAFDHDALDRRLELAPARVMILCNPHNPTGHVFSTNELTHLLDIARRHDMLIISDEIHSELVHPGSTHVPIATLPGATERTVTLTSASKPFNIAGLHYSVSHCAVPWVNERLSALPDHLFGSPNIMGSEAAHAAWTEGDEWLNAVVSHLATMRDLAVDLVRERLPGVRVHRPRATYLAWLDCRSTQIADNPHEAFRSAGVEVSPGSSFGPGGAGHVRLNFATSSAMLRTIISTMSRALAP